MGKHIKKKVTVIIPTLDRSTILLSTLKDLLKQQYPNFDIIVVDQTNLPAKKVMEFIKKNPPIIKYIHLQKKSSPHARNVGAKKATGEIVLFLDDDVEIKDPNFIQYHVDVYQDEKVGLVGGRVIYNSQEQPKYQEVGKIKYFGLQEITHFDSVIKTAIDHAAGGNFSCFRELYHEVGGFREIYKGNAHMEETDFCLRVKRTGCQLIFEPKAVVLHLQYPSGGNRIENIYEFRYWLVHNNTLFYLINFPKVLFPLYLLKQIIWASLSSIKRQDIKMFKTMTTAIFNGMRYYKNNRGKI